MQLITKLAFLLFVYIENVCSMEKSIEEETDTMILEAVIAESMCSFGEEQLRNDDAQKQQEKQRTLEIRSSQQCKKNELIVVDTCFCGMREKVGYTMKQKIDVWCPYGSYCYDSYTSSRARDAGCYEYKHCDYGSLEQANMNGDLSDTCLCGSSHIECRPGNYCSVEGHCLSENQRECQRNEKVFIDKCMCGRNECQRGSVCVQPENIPKFFHNACMQFCNPNKSEDGDDSECICSAPDKNPVEIKFCETTQTCTIEDKTPVCADVDVGKEDTWDEY